MESRIVIKRGDAKFEFPKSDLHTVNATHDGLTLILKDGLSIYYEQAYMSNELKNRICYNINKLEGLVKVDLLNSVSPVSVEIVN